MVTDSINIITHIYNYTEQNYKRNACFCPHFFSVASLRHTCACLISILIQYVTPVRWMDYLGKGEVLTNTDLDRFVNNI